MRDKEPAQPRRGLLPVTLFSPQAVPSTAASSLEWHVFPTVHHSVLQTLCGKYRTRLLHWPTHRHRFNLQGEDRPVQSPLPPESPWEPHKLVLES